MKKEKRNVFFRGAAMRAPSGSDKQRFVSLWERLKLPFDVEVVWKRVNEAYTERHRLYHNWEHILWCLSQFDLVKHRGLLRFPDAVELAIYFHDIVYEPGAPDNEDRSVDVAMQFLAGNWDITLRNYVKILIGDTKHTFVPITSDGQYMADIDVSSIGDPRENARYVVTIREEFLQFVRPEDYERGRREFIEKFLQKERIYFTEFFYQKYNDAARRNLAEQL